MLVSNNIKENCRCCDEKSILKFKGNVIGNLINYFECPNCGYLQTENPYWLDAAYEDVINVSDTGILARNITNVKVVIATLFILGKIRSTVVDSSGGYGILVRLLRDLGVEALWADPYCQNLLAKGFEYSNENAYLVTSFEAFEHFINPNHELKKILSIAPNVLLTTEIIPHPTPTPDEWWYFGKEHGQHIGFFKVSTLEYLAKKNGKYYMGNGGSYHLFTDRPHNKLLWRLLIKISPLNIFLMKKILNSKIYIDHLKMAKK
jgi:hypothetical protein